MLRKIILLLLLSFLFTTGEAAKSACLLNEVNGFYAKTDKQTLTVTLSDGSNIVLSPFVSNPVDSSLSIIKGVYVVSVDGHQIDTPIPKDCLGQLGENMMVSFAGFVNQTNYNVDGFRCLRNFFVPCYFQKS